MPTQLVMFTVTDTLALFYILWPSLRSSVLNALAALLCILDCSVEVFRFVSVTAELLRPARTLVQTTSVSPSVRPYLCQVSGISN